MAFLFTLIPHHDLLCFGSEDAAIPDVPPTQFVCLVENSFYSI